MDTSLFTILLTSVLTLLCSQGAIRNDTRNDRAYSHSSSRRAQLSRRPLCSRSSIRALRNYRRRDPVFRSPARRPRASPVRSGGWTVQAAATLAVAQPSGRTRAPRGGHSFRSSLGPGVELIISQKRVGSRKLSAPPARGPRLYRVRFGGWTVQAAAIAGAQPSRVTTATTAARLAHLAASKPSTPCCVFGESFGPSVLVLHALFCDPPFVERACGRFHQCGSGCRGAHDTIADM